ncbi:hypothetical protein [Lysinibacillus sp. RC79]|uniref:hypothetical protein n=1 Tax=Lysinibacillus sp. RC79 TaxID=3156296 RepID=UPI003514488A
MTFDEAIESNVTIIVMDSYQAIKLKKVFPKGKFMSVNTQNPDGLRGIYIAESIRFHPNIERIKKACHYWRVYFGKVPEV